MGLVRSPLRPVLPILLLVQLDDQLVGDVFSRKAGPFLIFLPYLDLLQSEPSPTDSGWIFLLLGKSYVRWGCWDSSRFLITSKLLRYDLLPGLQV